MIRRILTSLLLLCCATAVFAVPAHPAKYKYTQPDGSVIVLQNHGDEFYSWTTNEAGEIVEQGDDGFYRPITISREEHRALRYNRSIPNHARWSTYDTAPVTNFGDRKVLCIIANFTDSTFIVPDPNAHFNAMLNKEGYSENGAIGSVRDYFLENSCGLYRPQFDVYGPVTLSQSSDYYCNNKSYRVAEAIKEACEMMADQINIADYDTDDDGDIDMVLFYFPGHNQAEGGGKESIWPHQSSGNHGTIDGKTFNRYFCTSELRGNKGTEVSGIGTTCHEFAHSLGLPDFYDTDYEANGDSGYDTGHFDLMCAGNYNDHGRRPPYLSAVERNMLGWMEMPAELTDGDYTLAPVQQNAAYISRTETEGEYFVLECRTGEKWDSATGDRGLLIYHVDQSDAYDVANGLTGRYYWENTNKINAFGDHPCLYIVPPTDFYYAFPGNRNISHHQFVGWDGVYSGVMLYQIGFDGEKASFSVSCQTDRMMFGTVFDTSGSPIEGAQIVCSQAAHPFNAAPALLSGDVLAETEQDGYYEFFLPETAGEEQILTVRKAGYVPVSLNIPATARYLRQNFCMRREGEGEHAPLQYYDPDLPQVQSRLTEQTNVGFGFRYQADSLAKMGVIGHRIENIHFSAIPNTYDKVYVFVAFQEPGNSANPREIQLLREVTDLFVPGGITQIAVADADLTIPEGKNLYIGYGITGVDPQEHYLLMHGPQDVRTEGDVAIRHFLEEGMSWGRTSFGGKYYSFIVGAEISAPKGMDFKILGFASIVLVEGVPTAVAPADKTLYRVEWILDGEAVDTPPAPDTLTEGPHSYMARLLYYDGSSERVYYDVE